jgi:hypothetical protein
MDTQTLERIKTVIETLRNSNIDRLRKHKENIQKGKANGGLFDELMGKDAAYNDILDILDKYL